MEQSLFNVVMRGDVEHISNLLKLGVNVNCKNQAGCTPLHYCSSAEVLAELIRAGADPLAKNRAGLTCVHMAEKRGIGEALLQRLRAMQRLAITAEPHSTRLWPDFVQSVGLWGLMLLLLIISLLSAGVAYYVSMWCAQLPVMQVGIPVHHSEL